jgi:uncharacterized membrane protein YdbT with pleckstrin-like domain
MSYTQRSLSQGEQIIHTQSGSAWFILFSLLRYTLMVTLAAMLVGDLALWIYLGFVWYLVQRWFTEYSITTAKVIYKSGIVSRLSEEIQLTAVESVVLDQRWWERLLGVGTVWVRASGGRSIWFHRLGSAVNFRTLLQKSIDIAK